MPLNSAIVDVRSNYDAVTNYRFLVPVTGRYHVGGQVTMTNLNASTFTTGTVRLRLNGTTDLSIYTISPNATRTASNNMSLPLQDVLALTAGDTVELGIILSGGAGNTADLQGSATKVYTNFFGFLLG